MSGSNILMEEFRIIGTNREVIEDIPYEELIMKHYGIPIKWVME